MAEISQLLSKQNSSSASQKLSAKITTNSISKSFFDEKKESVPHVMTEFTLTWENINVYMTEFNSGFAYIKSKFTGDKIELNQNKKIINNVSGIAKPYEVLAILGASGAGKTTLLNVLNSRNRGSLRIDGDIKVNGHFLYDNDCANSVFGYVQQNDLFVGTLKVKEHLFFQAMLRMDKNTSHEERLMRIESVLEDLNLAKCKDYLIGSPDTDIKGISGGEKRRLSFASEILTNPSILFCDEPTSGLDSFMAISIVESMKNLAKNGKTIICTIHQPSSEIFEMFDKVCFLTEGKLAFIGDKLLAHEFFESEGFKCPDKYNPADFFIKTLSIVPNYKSKSIQKLNNICDGFQKSECYLQITNEISNVKTRFKNTELPKTTAVEKSSIFTQIQILFWRNFQDARRDPLNFRLIFLQSLAIGLLYGLIFYQLDLTQEGVMNINGVLFIFITNITFGSVFSTINTFPKEIPLFIRESQDGMYKVISYYISKTLIEFPSHFLVPILNLAIFYWMANLNNQVERFVICCVVMILVSYVSAGYSQFISLTSSSNSGPTELAVPLLIPFFIFSGFFLHNNSIPEYFLVLKYLSWFGYANEALQINQWSNIKTIKCDTTPTLCFMSGDDVLGYSNIKSENLSYNILMLLFLVIGWKILAYIMLLNRSYKK